MSQIELFDIETVSKQMTYIKLLEIELFKHLTELAYESYILNICKNRIR